jgi:hypothetical protein
MNSKLTLSLNSAVINSAKKNLLTKNTSLSSLVEDYFRSLLVIKNKPAISTPLVEELSGFAKSKKKVSEKSLITEYLLQKYL